MSTRKCGRCFVEKEHNGSTFVTCKGRVKTICRACWNAYNVNRRRADLVASREYHRAYQAEWRAKNPGKIREHTAKSRAMPGAKERQFAWAQANPVKRREAAKRSQQNNPATSIASAAKRRARLAAAAGTHSANDIVAQFNTQAGKCFYCQIRLSKFHVDHKTPLSRGGSNDPENIVCACISCNLSKGARTEKEFLHRIDIGLVPHIRKVG